MQNTQIIQNNYISEQTNSSVHTEYFSYTSSEEISLHSHEFLEIGITLGGTCTHFVNGMQSTLCSGSVYVIPVRTSHQIARTKDWEIRNIYLLPTVFSANFLNAEFSTYYKLQNFLMSFCNADTKTLQFTLRNETFCAIKALSDALKQSILSDAESLQFYQSHCIINMLLLLAEDYYAQNKNAVKYCDPRLIKINHFIYAHLEYPLKQLLSELSKSLSLNPQYINRIVKKSIGIPVSSYIIHCKIEKSIQLLLSDNATPTDVAYALGFYDYSHFHKYFTKYVGTSPHKYKK